MTPSASIAGRRAAARRRSAARRRWVLALLLTGVAVLAVVLVTPLFRKAVNEFNLPLAYAPVIRQQAREKHLDPALIAAVIYAETKFDPRASSAGAQGLMQILPQTAQFLARRSGATTFATADLATPEVNIAYGSYYLRYLLDRYGQSKLLALAAYNGGESNVDRWVGQARDGRRSMTLLDIPFPETRAYVTKVLKVQGEYRQTYPNELYGSS